MKRIQDIEGTGKLRLERVWMTSLVVCACIYMGCMMIEMGPKSIVHTISKPLEVLGMISGTALFVMGIGGAFHFSRSEE